MKLLDSESKKVSGNILTNLLENAASSVKKQIKTDKPEDAPKETKESLIKRKQRPIVPYKKHIKESAGEPGTQYRVVVYTPFGQINVDVDANSEEEANEIAVNKVKDAFQDEYKSEIRAAKVIKLTETEDSLIKKRQRPIVPHKKHIKESEGITIQEILDRYEGEYDDLEFYTCTVPLRYYHGIHTDHIDDTEDIYPEYYSNYDVIDYALMDEYEYDNTVLANNGFRADFEGWYGNKDAKVLVIIVNPKLEESSLKESVEWNYYNKFKDILDKYMPASGEGETLASQIVTAINKLVYKWYNMGDVYDNVNSNLEGWVLDLSSYANWLYKYAPGDTPKILENIYYIKTESEYEDLLKELADYCLNENLLSSLEKPKQGSIYECDGPFEFNENWDDEDDYENTDDNYDEDDEDDEELDESSFDDKVKAIKKSIRKRDKRTTEKSAENSAKRIAGSMIKDEKSKK